MWDPAHVDVLERMVEGALAGLEHKPVDFGHDYHQMETQIGSGI